MACSIFAGVALVGFLWMLWRWVTPSKRGRMFAIASTERKEIWRNIWHVLPPALLGVGIIGLLATCR